MKAFIDLRLVFTKELVLLCKSLMRRNLFLKPDQLHQHILLTGYFLVGVPVELDFKQIVEIVQLVVQFFDDSHSKHDHLVVRSCVLLDKFLYNSEVSGFLEPQLTQLLNDDLCEELSLLLTGELLSLNRA